MFQGADVEKRSELTSSTSLTSGTTKSLFASSTARVLRHLLSLVRVLHVLGVLANFPRGFFLNELVASDPNRLLTLLLLHAAIVGLPSGLIKLKL